MDRRSHRRRRRRRVGIGLALAAAFVVLAVWLALPAFVESRLRAELAARGFEDARFELAGVSLGGLEIRDLSLPEADLTIASIDVGYSLAGLWRAHIDRVEVRGLDWAASADSARMLRGAVRTEGAGWTVGRIDLRDVEIAAVLGDERRRSQWNARLSSTEAGLEATFSGAAAGRSIRGAVIPGPGGLRAWLTTAIAGRAELEIDVIARDRDEGTALELTARGERLEIGALALEGLAATGEAVLRDGSLRALAVTGRARRIASGEVAASGLEVELHKRGGDVRFAAAAEVEIGALAGAAGIAVEGAEPVSVSAAGILAGGRAGIERASANGRADAVSIAGGPRLGEVVASIEAAGAIDGSAIELAIAPGSSLVAERLDFESETLSLRSRRRVAIEAVRPVNVRIGRSERCAQRRSSSTFAGETSCAKRWSVAAGELAMGAAAIDVAAGDVRSRLSARLAAAVELSDDGARVGLAPGGELRVARLESAKLRLAPFDVEVSGGALIAGDRRPTGARVGLAAGPLVLREPVARRIGRLEADVALSGELLRADLALTGDAIRARLPLRWTRGRGLEGRGRIELAGWRWRGHRLPPVAGTVELAGRGWRFAGTAPISKASSVSIRARAPGLGLEGARLAARAPRATIDSDRGLGALLARVTGVAVDGTAGFDLEIAKASSRARIVLHDVRVSRGDLALFGVRGRIELTDPLALRSAPDQLIRWRSTTLGDRRLGLGSLRFELTGEGKVRIERAALRVGTGLLDTRPFVVDPRRPGIDVVVGLLGVELDRWLPVVSRGRVHGRGSLDGQVGLRIRWRPRWSASIGTGHLVATGAGRLRFRDPELLERMLRDVASDQGSPSLGRLIRQRLVASLVDFDFRELELRFYEGAKRPELQIHTRGRGHRVDQEVDLTVNLRGAEALLDRALRTWLESR